jgi:CBS domain-containing protein
LLTVADVMNTRRVVSVQMDDDVAFAARLMSWAGVRHLPVVDRDGQRVVGVFTERDYLRYRAQTHGQGGLDPVGRFMSAPAETVAPADPAAAASALMLSRRMGCLPVVDDGTLVGIVTTNDMLAADVHEAAPHVDLRPPVTGSKVRDVMTSKNLVAVSEDDTLATAAHRMAWLRVRHLPVTRDHEVVGVLSDRDVLGWRADGRSLDHRVGAAMTSPPAMATPDEDIAEAAARMIADRIDCLPVVLRGRLVGIVTSTDLLGSHVARRLEQVPGEDATAEAIMTPAVLTASPDDLLLEAADLMAAHGVRHLPVVDRTGLLIGILSERDVRSAFGVPAQALAHWTQAPGRDRKVRDVMTEQVDVVRPEERLTDVIGAMARRNVGALPVVDRAGRPVGIVSYLDVLRAVG